ncbi:hypothetical protein Slin15195_G041810 [Septoria linicola]|uniref:Uncharacterized protein n=1 Tax=Septoria linicola TaxID=215465 RepID=A0A9Q9ARS0_9PEZI|nr:hypothetical protein Slin14017_G045320 [Septoria linicola]USW50862.1 hypothetical protein Slin15195_G041810 [Septoria linicola]
MASYNALVEEVDRITGSPYPSQLRTLRDIAEKCSDADIAQWAAAKPCLVGTLASCLLEGLQQWSYVLDVITKFSFNAACRNAFLRQEPTLLHSVVAHAVKAGHERSKYTRASVALLSLPLPDTVALPAEAQTLFVQLVEEAAKRPCPGTIQPVYLILAGTGGLLLGVLSSDTMSRFEDHLLEILKNSSSTPDGCLSLYCLAIMNLVCASTDPEFRLTPSSYNTQDFLASTPASTKWKSEAMQQFFSGSKAQRSIQLVVLSAYLASKATAVDCTPEKIKSLVLANEIIAAIPTDIRKIWSTANPGMVRKLQERLCAEDVEEKIKTLALRFVGKLCELDSLPHPVLESLEMTYMEATQVQTVHILCPQMDDSGTFSGVLSRTPISILLENAMEYAIRVESAEFAAGAEAVTRIVAAAQTIIATQKITAHQIREMLSDSAFTGKLQDLRQLLESPRLQDGQSTSGGWCPKALTRTRSALAHQISNLLLRASQSSVLAPHAMTILLDLHALSARADHECVHRQHSAREALEFVGPDRAETTDEHIDWREALGIHFKARASVEQDAVTRLFARACAELEARCETVEQPLRDEQDKRKELEDQHSALSCAFDELESKYVDATLQLRTLEEKEGLQVEELQENEDRNARLLERVTQLEEQLRESQAEAQKQIGELKSAKQMDELNAAARLAQRQEALEDAEDETKQWKSKYKELAGKVSSFERGLEEAEVEREQLGERLLKSDSRVQELEREVGKTEAELEHIRSAKTSLEEDLRAAGDDDAERLRQLRELREDLQACQKERDSARSELADETARLEEALSGLRDERNQLTDRSKEIEDNLKQSLEDVQRELRDTTNFQEREIASKEAKISELKKKVERYQRKCQEKDQQISEAESMRSNLMAAMGINKNQSRASLPHRSRESVVPQTQSQVEDSPPSPLATAEDMDLSASNVEQCFISNADSQEDKSGPTPKRQKPRKSLSFAAPLTTTAKPRASVAGGRLSRASTGIKQSVGRQPLIGTSGNRANLKPFKTPTKDAEKHAGEDESTFEGSELFTGTQAGQMMDLQAAFDENS